MSTQKDVFLVRRTCMYMYICAHAGLLYTVFSWENYNNVFCCFKGEDITEDDGNTGTGQATSTVIQR